jgi:putative intracellular protease/amidase
VVVCGSPAFEAESQVDISAQLHQARKAGCIIAGICGATIALACAGMLDDVKHTSNGPGYLDEHVPDYSGVEKYVDQPNAVRDGDIITAPAPAPASFAAEVLAAAGLDPEKAHELKSMLGAEHAS